MRYNVEGDNLPVLKVYLEAGEQIQCEAGAMSWMDEGIEMQTSAGGLGKMLGRMFTNENAFMNTYIASQTGEIERSVSAKAFQHGLLRRRRFPDAEIQRHGTRLPGNRRFRA